ncbi:hypothetical protein BJV74DRAFT_839909 [Russula compacta]|nr:hypothetical protein BJV74DRAFT_839909 [Russula compacta]
MSCYSAHLTLPQALLATFATLPFLFAPQAWAAPHSNLMRRSGSSSGGQIVAPIVAALVFIVAILLLFYRNRLLSKLRRITLPSYLVRERPAPTTVRDLTAEEIAGTAVTNQAQAAAAAHTERRTRRNRRTPSQISTRSLPVYMKEPGELELVIIQGSQDMEDAPLTTQVVMPSVREDEDESANSHSHNLSQASYDIVNDDPHAQTPLLGTDEPNETTHERQNSNTHIPPTVDISDARYNDPSSPLRRNPNFADPRGEAPPYFEVVGDLPDITATYGDLARVDTTDTLPMAPDTLPATTSSVPTRRRSMFRGLIDAASRALSTPHSSVHPLPIPRPSRDMTVSPPPRPSNLSNRPRGTPSPRGGHRTVPSSGSVLSFTSSAFGRTISRTRSRSVTNTAADLCSPSTLSITSISAPLTHTVVRTDFVYPRSGPTPEQLKLISSVESVSKFGVPYGPDAVAYASASLVNLHGPPPGFEEHPSTDGLPGPSVAVTRARAMSALSRMSGDGNVPASRLSLSSLPSSSGEPEAATSHPEPETRPPVPDLSNGASAPELEPSEDKKEKEEVNPPRVPSPSPTVGTTSTAPTMMKATASELGVVSESLDVAVASGSDRLALPSFGSEMTTATHTKRNPSAPSSFRMPSTPLGRTYSASRSSSVDTFQTAASDPEQGQGSEHGGTSDTEQEAFADAESGGETEAETTPVTPHAVPMEVLIPGSELPVLSV